MPLADRIALNKQKKLLQHDVAAVSLSKKVTEKWPFSRIGDENAV